MNNYVILISKISKSQNSVIQSCNELINECKNNPNTHIILDFNDCNFIYPDYALLLLCAIQYIEKNIVGVKGSIRISKKSKIAEYLIRMNFFKNLKITLPYHNKSMYEDSSVQIQKYNSDTQYEILKKILYVLKEKSSMHEDVFVSIDYCLNEILDNVLIHSEQKEGWVVAQYFENINSIRLMVSDNGVGIYQSLKTRYDFTEDEAILKCVEEGVSNGKGQGHGLYAASKFIKLNRGWFSIISGNKRLNVTENKKDIINISHWQGTCVYFRINTNIQVDYKEFTSKYYDYKKALFEDLFDNSKNIT